MAKKYIVKLSKAEQDLLKSITTSGTQRVRKVIHANILLSANAGWPDQDISRALRVSVPTIERVRQRFVEEGLDGALTSHRTTRKYQYLLDGAQEAHLIALACGQPPAGYRRWSLRLLASQMVKLDYIDELSYGTVRNVMKSNELKPWLKEEWCIPPEQNAEFVYHMEDVLDVYHRPFDPKRPLICFDETPVQLISETRAHSDANRSASTLRLRILSPRNGQLVHVLCTLVELAACPSHRTSDQEGLGLVYA